MQAVLQYEYIHIRGGAKRTPTIQIVQIRHVSIEDMDQAIYCEEERVI